MNCTATQITHLQTLASKTWSSSAATLYSWWCVLLFDTIHNVWSIKKLTTGSPKCSSAPLLITKVCATCPLFILCLGIAFLPHQRCDSCSNAVVEVGFRRPVVSLGKLLNPKNYFRWLCRKCVCMREWESLWAIWIGSAALLLMNSWHLPRPAVYECECVRECGWITQGKWALLQLLYLTF